MLNKGKCIYIHSFFPVWYIIANLPEDGAAEVYEGRERPVELRGVYEGADGEREGLMLLG